MKLKEVIKAIRINKINELLGEKLSVIDYEKIILYAECTIGTDTLYRFVKFKRGMGKLIKDGDMWYERLCSLKELDILIDHYLSLYDRKTDDVLVIDIIDHFDNPNI